MDEGDRTMTWHRVARVDDLPEGRVRTVSVTVGTTTHQFALTHVDGSFHALDNRCPHQGGPLGEGSIECTDEGECYLRCPWHGWDFDPATGDTPDGHDDGIATFPVEIRDGEIFVGLEGDAERTRTVTDVMAETMVNWGVTHVFGMVGHSNLGLADAIRVQADAENLEYIGIRHEGAGAFAASAFGKLTGRPAACLAIAGPGATNLLTGCWDAKVDRAPLLALTGQVRQQVFGPGAFQELPLKEAFSAVAGFSHLALPGSNHAELMNLALKSALVNRDVAHIIFPDDVQTLPATAGQRAGDPAGRMADDAIVPPTDALDRAVALLAQSKRPLIVVGHGARFAMDAVIELAEELRCPVVTTFKAKGLIGDMGCQGPTGPGSLSSGHVLGAGVLGRSGTPIASWFMNECDSILVLGASFSNHTGITQKRPTIQVDFDRMHLGKTHSVDVPVWGEVGVTARLMLKRVKSSHNSIDHTEEVAIRWGIWRAEKASRMNDNHGRGMNSAVVFDALTRIAPGNAIFAVDVGNNTYSFGRYFESSGDQAVLMSGYLGSIGFGYPAAIGAWAATRAHRFSDDDHWRQFADRPVFAITGDGGFGQYAWEVNTAAKYNMNITHVLLNNGELGKITKEQRAGAWPVWQTSLTNPHIADYVTSCGGLGIRVENATDLDSALERAMAFDGPATVEILTDAELL
ncbi:MAG TPA: thiamine pyrophosphate-binding protein [Actinobacteria bacterium]|nr:thiamine pyrophosphate-binding protein [Actinomycetota bacterium]